MTSKHALRRLSRRAVLAAGVGGALALPGFSARSQSLKKVTYVTTYKFQIAWADVLVAKEAGFFAKNGLDVDIIGANSATQGIQQLLSGQADLTMSVGVTTMRAAGNEGAPLVSIATQVHDSYFSVYSLASKPITKLEDMAGKTIGVTALRGATDLTLDLALRRAGIDPSSVRRETVAISQAAIFGLMETGRLDGNVSANDVVDRMTGSDMQFTHLPLVDGLPSQVFVSSSDVVSRDPEMLLAFMRSLKEAVEFLIRDEGNAETLPMLAKYEIPDLANAAGASAQLNTFKRQLLDRGKENLYRNLPEQWESSRQILVEAGMLKPDADTSAIFTNRFVDGA